ncbi:hypothetical protein HF521_001969 [Silurus meridionalis]|uniref:LRAT domain-containing protein n=1 Tax=Silurus meridionalis TaxID=175797 RepID=A0A8T0B367_SILME|nr:hypothetical protein HF521_001969 [Silurus meridionalis]
MSSFLPSKQTWIAGLGGTPKGFSVVKTYEDEYNGNSDLGDLFMVESHVRNIYHAGVMCSDVEIIQFTQIKSQPVAKASGFSWLFGLSSSTTSPPHSESSTSCTGLVSKVNVDGFTQGMSFAIYRKDGGIPASFEKNVKNAMQKNKKYDFKTYNCIHFAMELLEVEYE